MDGSILDAFAVLLFFEDGSIRIADDEQDMVDTLNLLPSTRALAIPAVEITLEDDDESSDAQE